MTKLTNNELEVLTAIDNSEYGDHLTDGVWMFTISDHSKLTGKTISGTVSSLVKKGLVMTDVYGGPDADIQMTDAGAAAYIKATNGKTNKPMYNS